MPHLETATVVAAPAQPSRPYYPSGAAVIIETRVTPKLVSVMLHFASVLGPNWPVVLYTLEDGWATPTSAPLARALASDRVRVRHLPPNTTFPSHHSVSLFLTRPWLWEELQSAPRVLLFQTDSVVCANANATIDDFADWDLIGAPIAPGYGSGYNGGLSLRNPRLMRDIARLHGRGFESGSEGGAPGVRNEDKFEDQWFYGKAQEMGARLPSPDLAREFAVETVYYEKPWGFHQPARWQQSHMSDILAWCPEVGMLQ